MADKRITELTAGVTLADADLYPVVQGGLTKKFTMSQTDTYINSKIDGKDLETTLEGSMNFLIRDGGVSKRVSLTGIKKFSDDVGDIKFNMVGGLGSDWHELDGSLVDSATSIFHEKRLPNLNGGTVELTDLVWTADGSGSYATIPEADRWAIGAGDSISGSGISGFCEVLSMDYDTGMCIMTQTAISGTITTSFVNEGRSLVGGDVMASIRNQMQLIEGNAKSVLSRSESGIGTGVFSSSTWSDVGYSSTGSLGGNFTSFKFSNSDSPNARTSADTTGRTKTDAYRIPAYMKIV